MIDRFIISCQSPHAGGDSLNIVNGELIDEQTANKIKIADLCYADSSFSLYSKDENASIYRKKINDKQICVIYGHLNEKDDSGRRIPYCTYTEFYNDITEVICELSKTLNLYGYSAKLPTKEIPHKIATYNKKKQQTKLAIGIIMTLATLSVVGYAIYSSYNNHINKINTNGTEQTNQGDSIRR